MALACPNKNDSQWIKMVDTFGEDLAHYHFVINNYDLLTNEQIADKTPKMSEEEIKLKLMQFVQRFGFDVSQVPTLLKEKGFTVKALVDLSSKAIKIYHGATNIDFAEESAHIALELMNGDQTLNRAVELAQRMPEFKDTLRIYKKLYPENAEIKAAKEVIAKRIASHVFNQTKPVQPQAEESRFISTIKSLWRKFLGKFNNAQAIKEMEEFVTNLGEQILNNQFEAKSELQDGIYYSVDYSKSQEILDTAIDRISKRRKSLRQRSVAGSVTSRIRDQLQKLEESQAKAEADKGLIQFLDFLQADVNEAKRYMANSKKISSKAIRNLKDFIDYYEPIINEIRLALNKNQIFTELPDREQERIKEQLVKYREEFQNIKDFYVESHAKLTSNIVKEYLDEIGIEPDFDLETIFSELSQDAWALQYWFGSIKDTTNPIARVIYGVVGKAKLEVEREAHDVARNLVNYVRNQKGITNTSDLVERNSKGETTGYFLTPYNLDEFFKAKDKFEENLRKEFNLSDGQFYPVDAAEQIKFNKKRQEWLTENTERRFTEDYYKLRESLSIDAEIELKKFDALIKDLLYKFRDSEGNVEFHKMSESEWNKLKELKVAKNSLGSLYYSDGTKKVGVSLRIAEEISEWKKKRAENVSYKKDIDAYNKALSRINAKVKSGELTQEDKNKWVQRNTETTYSQDFWDELSAIDKKDYGEEYTKLTEKRNDILKPYRNAQLEVDMNLLPDETKEVIQEIDAQIRQIVENNKTKKRSEFNKIASIEKTQDYKEAIEKAKKDGTLNEFMKKEHYIGKNNELVPHSYWTHIVPRKQEQIIRQPSGEWSEIDKESPYYNKNFDETWRGLQPKKSKYQNQAYNNLSNNQKEVLKKLISTKHEMDDKIVVSDKNHYLLPQISQSLNDAIMSRSNLKDSLKEFAKESWQRRADDTEFGDQNMIERPDGSKSKFVPMYYTRKLEDPKVVSTDLLSSIANYSKMALNYEKMNRITPDIEVLKEQIGTTRLKDKENREIKLGVETNIYKMIDRFMDVQLYGISKTNFKDVKVAGVNINTAKLANNINSYIRTVNLMFNVFTSAAGNVSGFINSRMADLVGRYTTSKAKALANIEFTKLLPHAITEFKKISKSNKMNLIIEKFNLIESFEDVFDNLDKARLGRIKGQDVVYSTFKLGDYALKANTALAVMFNYRYHEGNFYTELQFKKLNVPNIKYSDLTPIYDMYEVQNHKLVPKKEYKDIITNKEENYLHYTTKYLATKFDGSLTELDRTAIHYDTWGQLIATHRNWLIGGIADRFKKRSVNFMTGEIETGYHRETFSFFSQMYTAAKIGGIKKMLEDFNNLDEYQKESLYRSLRELVVIAALILTAKLINAAAEDEDDKWMLQAAAYLTNRVIIETSSLSITPMPMPYNELVTVLNSPIAGVRQIEAIQNITEILNTDIIQSGTYEGYTKQQRAIMKLIPGFKGFMNTINPEAANQFLMNKPLKQIY